MQKSLQNKLVKLISQKQNDKSKMNAGQIRELLKLYLSSIQYLSSNEKLELIKYLSK